MKPSSVARGNVSHAGLSPAFCGGLIEAGTVRRTTRCSATLSPAFCGGLIEAALARLRTAAAWATFPRVLRGPH